MTSTRDHRDELFVLLGRGVVFHLPYVTLLRPLAGDHHRRLLANLAAVAQRLQGDPELWRSLIREQDWRSTILGTSAALLAGDARFLDDLLYRLRGRSWVSPQLAVALGILHPSETVAEFEAMLWSADTGGPKEVFSAYAVLKAMGRESAEEFESGTLYLRARQGSPGTSHLAYDASIAMGAVAGLWPFWCSATGQPLSQRVNPETSDL